MASSSYVTKECEICSKKSHESVDCPWFYSRCKFIPYNAPQYKGGCYVCMGDHDFDECPWSQTLCINPKCNSTMMGELKIAGKMKAIWAYRRSNLCTIRR
ncbi:hypothetical protein C5167_048751 [Papaver somniferum]|uniref:Uncharacterized protein n=1 Tax=Papaver somniferum TaxID=3469 RepID=A0A4Y7KLK7_PAPSO|nr:hypothetical protein C5167_048751 [Papaver somniferum]